MVMKSLSGGRKRWVSPGEWEIYDGFLVKKTSTHMVSKALVTSSKIAPVYLFTPKFLLTVDMASQKERRDVLYLG